VQTWFEAQATPHPPQLRGSVSKLTHWVGVAGGGGHASPVQVHSPAEQENPDGQVMPQPPQFWRSACVFTQAPEQSVAPALQTQAAAWQVPKPQAKLHEPQLLASVCLFTQRGPQASGVAAGQVHAPAVQVAVAGQLMPQSPQWLGSVWRSTQAPLHAVCPVGEVTVELVQAEAATAASSATNSFTKDAVHEFRIGRLPGRARRSRTVYPLAPWMAPAGMGRGPERVRRASSTGRVVYRARRPAGARVGRRGTDSARARVSRNFASVFCRFDDFRDDFRDGRVPGAKSS
jgi:hypothetical protein